MENNFNLRKFLIENKLTTNSKMLKEEQQPVETLTFGYDLENTKKVQDYLVANYKTSSNQPDILGKEDDANPDCEIVFDYGGDTISAVDIFNPAILQDRKFMSLVNACEGEGHFEEGDEEYDDEHQ
jgi:hypothetical protein